MAYMTSTAEQRSVIAVHPATEITAHCSRQQIADSIPDGTRTGFQIKIPIVLGILGKFLVKTGSGATGVVHALG
jgi:hypothetical protein